MVTKTNIKLRLDFNSKTDFINYLVTISHKSVSRVMIINRLNRGWHPYNAATTKKLVRPSLNHPYKQTYGKKLSEK